MHVNRPLKLTRQVTAIPLTDKALKGPQSAPLLTWYDRHHRDLPWRISPSAAKRGVKPDPYYIWMSEVMLQQTTVAAVKAYFAKFIARWPTVKDLAEAPNEDVMAAWAGLGYYARARNLKKCAEAVTFEHGGIFPDTEEGLRALPGIGDYTSAAVAAIAFNRPAAVMDGNVERVISRLYAIEAPLPGSKPQMKAKVGELTPIDRPGDFAQAMMDLGATICTPKNPACALLPLNDNCAARLRGDQETFPRKAPKKTGTLRRGAAFVVTRGDELLVRTRPEKGLLGGMTEVPTSEWLAGHDDKDAREQAPAINVPRWHRKAGVVTHVFTHFPLELVVYTASVAARTRAPQGMRWVPVATLKDEALPNVMRKVIAHGLALDPPNKPSRVRKAG